MTLRYNHPRVISVAEFDPNFATAGTVASESSIFVRKSI